MHPPFGKMTAFLDIKRFVAIVLLLFITVQASAQEPKKDIPKFQKLKEKVIKNQFVTDFTGNLIESYAASKRNFTMVVVFTIEGPQSSQCPMCLPAVQEFGTAAKHYYQSLGPEFVNGSKFLDKPIFFAKCDIRNAQDLWVASNWRTLPQIAVLPPQNAKRKFNVETHFRVMPSLEEDYSASAIVAYISANTGYEMKIEPPLIQKFGGYLLGLLALYWIASSFLPNLWRNRRNPMLWFAISLGVFGFSMAGIVFNAINHPALFYVHPVNGQRYLIYPSPRQQFVIEGLLVSAILTTLSLLMIGLVSHVPAIKDPWKQRGYAMLFGIGFVMVFTFCMKIFKMKYPYYPY